MGRLLLASICLTALLALHLPESKATKHDKGDTTINKKVMQHIAEQKTSEAIKKLEKQFKSTFMAYTSTNDKGKKQQAHEKLEGLVNLVKREAKENLQKSVKGYQFDVNRLSGEETGRVLTPYIRQRRQSWGSCQPVCQHRCIPTCDLLCCITTPFVVPKKLVKKLEKQLAKAHLKKKSKISNKHSSKKSHVCEKSCQKACLPSCKFSCCFKPKKHG